MKTGSKAVIVGTARTPFGRLGGALSGLSATTLAAAAIRGLLERGMIAPEMVEHVILGQVLQAGAGQAPVRQALLKAGLATTVTGETVNKVCASGLVAAVHAARMIRAGEARAIVAGGVESMSNTPYLVPGARAGLRFGDGRLVDGVLRDGLLDAYLSLTMADAAAGVAEHIGPSREVQDAFAYQSHRRAAAAIEADALHAEIVPLLLPERGRDALVADRPPDTPPTVARADIRPTDALALHYPKISPFVEGDRGARMIEHDESVRLDVSLIAMANLRPLRPGGTITAGNAPGLTDGAAMLMIMDEDFALQNDHAPLAEIVGHASVAWEPAYLALTPALAVEKLLAAHDLVASDIDVWEINEAFAAVAVRSAQHLQIGVEQINKQGGAIALGHPLGASGARIIGSAVRQLTRGGGRYAVAAICSGGGQGDAVLLRSCAA